MVSPLALSSDNQGESDKMSNQRQGGGRAIIVNCDETMAQMFAFDTPGPCVYGRFI